MKRILCCLMAAMMTLTAGAALAELQRSAYTIASGNVAAVSFVDVTAPWSGTLLPFDLEAGDTVTAEQVLFRLRTQTVYAPENGTVTAVFAREGDDAAAVLSHYGAVLALEAEHPYRIQASTSGAYNKSKNRELHAGETLYFQETSGDKEKGSGVVFSVSGENYAVEILEGDFDTRENLSLYRSDAYENADKVGSGVVVRRDPITVQAAGRIGKIHVREGDAVEAGDALLTCLGPDADPGADSEMSAGYAGVVANVAVAPGQQVWKGQLLARVYRTDALEVVAEVDEMDLSKLRVGDVCPVTLDMDEDTVLSGTVTEISGLGYTRQNAAYYQVHLSLSQPDLPLGASASVYIPKE